MFIIINLDYVFIIINIFHMLKAKLTWVKKVQTNQKFHVMPNYSNPLE